MSPKYWWTGLLLVVGALNPVFGGDPTEVRGSPGRCAVCGRPGPCQQKVCRIECGVEKVKKYCWCVEAADVCTMLPSHPGRSRDPGCDACGAAESCDLGCQSCDSRARPSGILSGWIYDLGYQRPCPVPPQVGRTRSIKKLVKKEYEVEVPVYKTVVQYVCAECLAAQACGVCTPAGEGSPAPSPSPADQKPEAAPKPDDSASLKPATVSEIQAVNLAPLPPM